MARKVTAVVIGAGGRGRAYADYFRNYPDEGRVVAVCDTHEGQLNDFAQRYEIPPGARFLDWRALAAKARFADVAIITTPDSAHREPAVAFADLGYDILLEKPMAPTLEDSRAIAAAVLKNKVLCAICHVLRYNPHYVKIKQMLAEGLIGKLMDIQSIEQVAHWHMAHSFVRGNWRSDIDGSPMLLAKCCHDMDLLAALADSPCTRVSSFGSLSHFRKECQPPGAADRCTVCPSAIERNCPYSAVRFYLEEHGGREECWPSAVLTLDHTPAGVRAALETGPYGRCVYACDNNVVDHQVVNLEFADGATASVTMTAFTRACARVLRLHGTRGEIIYDEEKGIIHNDFATGKSTQVEPAAGATDASFHGGGDHGLMRAFVAAVRDRDPARIGTDVLTSLASHKIVFAAEKSRLEGKVVRMTGAFDVRKA